MSESVACSYCGYEIEVADDFLGDIDGGQVEERYDENSGAILLVYQNIMIECSQCRSEHLLKRRTINPKGISRSEAEKAKEEKAKKK